MANKSVILELIVQDKNSGKVTSRLQKQFSGVERQVQSTDKRLSSLAGTSRKSRTIFSRSAGAMGQGFSNASRQVQGSTTAVSNLSRIVEDAPFGIRGVANNINPFIQSFQQMSKQAGGTAAAMKGLLSAAFTGPGALLTISALITSTMTAIQMGLFDMGEEAEETEEALQGVIDRIDAIIDIQAEFGAFEDDPFGIVKLQARIREITEDIAEQRMEIREINRLEQERRNIVQQAARGQEIDQERLETIDAILERKRTEDEIEERITELQNERLSVSDQLVSKSAALADSDTQQARAAQQTRKEKERQLELEEKIREARQSVEFQRTEGQIFGADIQVGGVGGQPPEGSIAAAEQRMNRLQNMFRLTPFQEGRNQLLKQIRTLSKDIEKMEGRLKDAGNAGERSMALATQGASMLGNALSQAIIRGERLGGVFKSLLAQVASSAFINLLSFALGGKPLGIVGQFFGKSFAHGTDMGFPGVGMVGERGKELVVAPPMSSVITNENVEALARMKEDASSGAAKLSSVGNQGISNSIKEAVQEGLREATLPTPVLSLSSLKKGLTDFDELQERIGNG